MGRSPEHVLPRSNSTRNVLRKEEEAASSTRVGITSPLMEIANIEKKVVVENGIHRIRPDSGRVAKIASLFSTDEKTKELESIIALKSRQIWRLQKEIKNLVKIQQQQAQAIEGSFEDSKEVEEKLHNYEQRQRVDARTIKQLQDKLNEITAHYQRLVNSHLTGSEEKKKKALKPRGRGALDPVKTVVPEISGVSILNNPLPPVPSAKGKGPDKREFLLDTSAVDDDKFVRMVEFFRAISIMGPKETHLETLVASEACKLVGAARGTLFVIDTVRQDIVSRASKKDKPFRFPIGSGIVGHVVKTGKTLRLSTDIAKFDSYDPKIDDVYVYKTGFRPTSAIYVPVHGINNEVVGVLQLMHLQRAFTEQDEHMLQMVERQIGAAIHNHQYLDSVKIKLNNTAELLNACKAISSELDVGPLSVAIFEKSVALLNCESCNVYLVDSSTKELCLISANKEEKRYPLNKGIVGHVGSTGEEIIARDAKEDARFDPEVDTVKDKSTHSLLCVPITNENHDILGVIEVINKHTGKFDEDDAATLRSLAEQIYESLSNAELFHKTLSGFNAALSIQQKYQSLLEVAESLTCQLDEDQLINFIMRRAKELVNAERCSLFLVDEQKNELRSKVAEGTEEIRFPNGVGIAGHVATTGETLNILDAYEDPRFNDSIDKQTGFHTHNILCMPIYNDQEEIIGVTQLINKKEGVFTKEDEEILRAFSIFCGITLRNAGLYKQAVTSQQRTKALLDIAVALSSETNIQPLLRSIMKHARKLVKADRCSLFMLDPENRELRTEIAEGIDGIRIPMQNGIVGYVASTGQEVAIPDAYKDPRFNPEIDKETGYHTKSMLCVPIRDQNGNVIAVTQMINKRIGVFKDEDKDLLEAFGAFASKSLSLVKVPVKNIPVGINVPTVDPMYIPNEQDKKEITSWSFDVWKYSVDELIKYCIATFETFNLIKQFAVPMDRLVNFLKTLSKTYKDVPYHNFYHAVDVLQTVFLFLYHTHLGSEVFSSTEILAILIAAICHDVDHGGLNNAFHVKAQTPLALLYKDTSVLETHHCSRSITLLSEVENDILSGLNEVKQSEVWKMMISAILATDMSLHFALLGQFEVMVKEKTFNKDNFEHRKLVANMLLKCADISNVVKPFHIAKHWAHVLCEEFFMQGDVEKAKGLDVSPLMDRNTVITPQMQLGFINSICVSIFTLLTTFLPSLNVVMENLRNNIQEWNKILQKAMNNNANNPS